jgi:hypothetical protein
MLWQYNVSSDDVATKTLSMSPVRRQKLMPTSRRRARSIEYNAGRFAQHLVHGAVVPSGGTIRTTASESSRQKDMTR